MNEPPSLTTKEISALRSRAHPLEPKLSLGKQGASEGFRRQLDQLLTAEELVKLRLGRHVDVDLRDLAAALGAVLVHKVGRTAVLYRPKPAEDAGA